MRGSMESLGLSVRRKQLVKTIEELKSENITSSHVIKEYERQLGEVDKEIFNENRRKEVLMIEEKRRLSEYNRVKELIGGEIIVWHVIIVVGMMKIEF